jgi:hypothetical protein
MVPATVSPTRSHRFSALVLPRASPSQSPRPDSHLHFRQDRTCWGAQTSCPAPYSRLTRPRSRNPPLAPPPPSPARTTKDYITQWPSRSCHDVHMRRTSPSAPAVSSAFEALIKPVDYKSRKALGTSARIARAHPRCPPEGRILAVFIS